MGWHAMTSMGGLAGTAGTAGTAGMAGTAGTAGTAGFAAPVVGWDGGVGYPAYSGLHPSPMVNSALTTSREAGIAGDAAWHLYQPTQQLLRQPFLTGSDIGYDWSPRPRVAALQASVRAALVEMELLEPLRFVPPLGAHGQPRQCALELSDGANLVTIGGLDDTVFDAQLQLVESFAALRAERTSEILTQVVPQTAHWSSIAALSPDKHRFTWEVIGIGLRFAMMIVMRFKYAFNVQRAWQRTAVIQPMILTPGHAAYPSGHATEGAFVAELLPLLMGDPSHPRAQPYPSSGGQPSVDHAGKPYGMARQLNRLGLRVAENRVVAGLHYPVDTIAGQVLGVMLARYFVWLTRSRPAAWLGWERLEVGATAFPAGMHVDGAVAQPRIDGFIDQQQPYAVPGTTVLGAPPPSPVLQDLWLLARREWVRS